MSTGQPREDAKIAFDRERRRRVLSRLASRMRFEPDDVSHMLPFEEVVAALGATQPSVDLGVQVIPLDSIVGTVDRRRGEFDRDFRPSPNTRGRWERIAEARKRGEAMPPIDVFRIGDLHFVQDGHHRVSVARALGRQGHQRQRDRGADQARRRRASCRCATCRSSPTSACSTSACRCRPRRASASSSPTSGATRSSRRWSSPGATARA